MALLSDGGMGGTTTEVWRSPSGDLFARLSDGRVVSLATGRFQTYIPPLSQRVTTSLSTQSISNQYPYAWQYVPGVPVPSATATPTPTPTATPYVNTGALGQSYPQPTASPTASNFSMTLPKASSTITGRTSTSTKPQYQAPLSYATKTGTAPAARPIGSTWQEVLQDGSVVTYTQTALGPQIVNFREPRAPTGGGGFAPTPYAQTERGVADQRAFEAEQARLAREAAAAEAERNRLEQLRQSRFSALQGIVDRFIAEQGQASRLVAGLGPDQFKMAAALQGLPVLGTTPQAGFAQAQTEFASRPVPNVSAEAPLSDIESAIAAIGGIKPPSLPTSGFGMAMGGTLPGMVPEMIPPQPMPEQPSGMMPASAEGGLPGQEMMQPGMMGPPAAPGAPLGGAAPPPQFGTTKTAVLIGEGNLQVEPGTEVAITDTATGTTEIIPLTGQAATGASIFSPGYGGFAQRPPGTLFDPMSGVASISPLYAGMGLSQFPTRTGTPGASASYPSASTLGRLGYAPSLIHNQGTVYYRDPTTSQYRGITSPDVFNKSGFDWSNIVNMDTSGLPMGPVLSSPELPAPGTGSQSFSQKLGQPLVEPMTGAILPAPQANAFKLAQLAARSPGLFELALKPTRVRG